MASKKDPQTQTNIDRTTKSDQSSGDLDTCDKSYNDDEMTNESDSIKNANATGLGAIGKTDENETDTSDGGATFYSGSEK